MTKMNKRETNVEEANKGVDKVDEARMVFEKCLKEIEALGFVIMPQPFIRPDGGIGANFAIGVKPEPQQNESALATI